MKGIPDWVKAAGLVLSFVLMTVVPAVVTLWLGAKSKVVELQAKQLEIRAKEAELLAKEAELRASSLAAEDARGKTRRAEDRSEDERQGKFWRGIHDRLMAETTAKIAHLEGELKSCRDDHMEARETSVRQEERLARQEERLAAEADRTRIMVAQLDQMRELFRRSGLDPGSALHDALKEPPKGG